MVYAVSADNGESVKRCPHCGFLHGAHRGDCPAIPSNQPEAGQEVKPTITLNREQLADILYSAVVQGRHSIHDHHRAMPVGAALNQIAEGIAHSVFERASHERK